jgi:hypothetical protein
MFVWPKVAEALSATASERRATLAGLGGAGATPREE